MEGEDSYDESNNGESEAFERSGESDDDGLSIKGTEFSECADDGDKGEIILGKSNSDILDVDADDTVLFVDSQESYSNPD